MSATRGVRGAGSVDADALSARILRDVYAMIREAPQIAERHGMTMRELAAWASGAEQGATVAGLCRLEDVRAELLFRRARVKAVIRLTRLTGDASGEETRRKACVDLLSLRGSFLARGGGEEEGAVVVLQEGSEAESIRSALERSGARAHGEG